MYDFCSLHGKSITFVRHQSKKKLIIQEKLSETVKLGVDFFLRPSYNTRCAAVLELADRHV